MSTVGASTGGWQQRREITVTNPNAAELRDYQTRIVLDTNTFDFDHAQPGGDDLRFTDASATKQLNHWVERYDAAAKQAIVWVKVPQLPPTSTHTLFLYSGNLAADDLSSGRRTFEMFDDFGQPGLGFYAFGAPTTILTKTEAWETQAPHTLSVVELKRDGYKYWGYYGLADCGGIGIARSNDLATWDKTSQPLFTGDGERWPSAIAVGDTVYMIYDRDHCGTSHLVLRTSTDGGVFSDPYRVIVRQEQGVRNQNPALFHDPIGDKFHLYWFRGGAESGFWQIKMRSAGTVEKLVDAASERVLLDVPYELAAPNMMFADGVYYLSTEVNENAWKTKVYAGPTPAGPFTALPDAPQLSDNQACLFQHVFTPTVMHGTICKIIGNDWVLQHRTADLGAGRLRARAVDTGVWQRLSGAWETAEVNDGAGMSPNVVLSATANTPTNETPGAGLMKTALAGADYAFGVRGKSMGGAWGVAVRVQDDNNLTRVIVQPRGVLLIERVIDGNSAMLATVPLPAFDASAWHSLEARVYGDTTEAWLDGARVARALSDQPPSPSGHGALFVADGGAQFDDVIWRKVALEEPTVAIGAAESRTASSTTWLSDARPEPIYAPVQNVGLVEAQSAGEHSVLTALAALFTLVGAGIVVVGFARSRG